MQSGEFIVFADDLKSAVVLLGAYAVWNGNRKLALRTFNVQLVSNRDLDPFRQGNGFISYS